ncbi:putative zinc-binding protein [Anaeroselena agilis]|uniref:Zinc-binding protein n=1 Tax=Anaeroselena agilis TaxID=3063788 RepID=A0ABU3NXZ3_9FIRM|nr:putative zinc-binding protein [Selenomonadales bacterium 4137-cl]
MSQCCSSCAPGRICPDGQRYATKQMALPPKKAVIACEGACIKGEVARSAANLLAYRLKAENAVRICLGDAATGDSGMTELVRRAPEVIAIEGCPLCCGLTVLRSRIPNLAATVIDASKLYSFDREANFEIFDLPREQIDKYAGIVAEHAAGKCFANN